MLFTPHPYQSRAIDFLIDNPRAMLFLDMGLGKSVIALTAFVRLLDGLQVRGALIVAPKSVAEATWSAEIAKWNHLYDLRCSLVIGTEKQRIAALNTDADIYVISRDNLVWLVSHHLRDITQKIDMLILDELSSFKNPKAQRFKAVRALRPSIPRIVGLTGTPAPNGYLDLWAQVFCIDGGERLGQFITRYRDRYFRIENPYVTWPTYILAPGAQTTIEEKIADITLSMRAEDYLTLPDRIDIPHYVTLPPSTFAEYERFQRTQVLNLLSALTPDNPPISPENPPAEPRPVSSAEIVSPQPSPRPILAANAAALANKLMQFANGAIYDEDHGVHPIHKAKLAALLDIVEAAHSPVLIFYAFQHDADAIREALPEARVYSGAADLDDWNAGRISVLLAHPASTAYGLNMQQGGHIIVWYGLTWNLELYQQACARLHRQGQQHPVLIYHLIAKGTIDERAYYALSRKANTQNHLLNAISELIKKYE